MSKKMKPIAVGITDWHPYKEIIYKCANCGQDFRIFGAKEHFCHTCGMKVDWKNVLLHISEPIDKDNYDAEQKLIKKINKINKR